MRRTLMLTCAGLVMGLVFFTCSPLPLYGPAVWHVVFLIINLVQIQRLVVERRRLRLSEEKERVGEAVFQDLPRDEILTLLTRLMCHNAAQLQALVQTSRQALTPEERALRDIAFSRLSRKELVNLLTRRLWDALRRRNPLRTGAPALPCQTCRDRPSPWGPTDPP